MIQFDKNSLKWVSLVVLVVQTTALVLILRYSRTQKTDGPKYLSSTVVFISEVVKFITCVLVLLWNNNMKFDRLYRELDIDIFKRPNESLKVGVPAFLYVVQNNLLFLALSKLDAATYQVTYQLKILTTAFFSVTMLSRRLNILKWLSLIMLTTGVALVQIPKDSFNGSKANPKKLKHGLEDSNQFIGLIAIIAACFSSGFAGVYFERILKTSAISLWMRNLQLAFFSIFGAFAMTLLYDWDQVTNYGFFQGYNSVIWVVVALQAYGGLLIALVVKYADNILKGFATSLSILLSSLISWWFLEDFEPTLLFIVGASIVVGSTFLYGYEPPAPAAVSTHSIIA